MKKNHIILYLSLCAILIGMLLSYVVSTNLFTVRVSTISLVDGEGHSITGKLYVPHTATSDAPAPTVITCSGGNSEYVRNENINMSLAAHGYVVITFNPYKHGNTDIAESCDMGASQVLLYANGLDFVDSKNIALEGHTFGGAYLSIAAMLHPELVQSLIVLDCVSIEGSLQELTPETPFHVAWVISRYSEHFKDPASVMYDPIILESCGRNVAVTAGEVYTMPSGVTRRLYWPSTTATAHSVSSQTINYIICTLGDTLAAPVAPAIILPWQLLFFSKALSFFGVLAFAMQLLGVVLRLASFRSLCSKPSPRPQRRSPLDCMLIFLIPVLIGLLYEPIFTMGKRAMSPTSIFPQTDSNGLAVWCCLAASLYVAACALLCRKQKDCSPLENSFVISGQQLLKTFVAAFLVFSAVYALDMLYTWAFADHFSFFCTTLSLYTPRRIVAAVAYFPVFFIFFIASGVFQCKYLYIKSGILGPNVLMALSSCISELILIAWIYLPFLFVGQSGFYGARFANSAVMYILPLLPFFGIVNSTAYRRTGNAFLGAFLNTFFYTWVFVATNAMELIW